MGRKNQNQEDSDNEPANGAVEEAKTASSPVRSKSLLPPNPKRPGQLLFDMRLLIGLIVRY